jgi:hypothetical protein
MRKFFRKVFSLLKNPKKKRYGRVRKQIERTRNIAALEMCWYKKPREDLSKAAIIRARDWSTSREPKEGERMFIHTHPKKSQKEFGALPSVSDMDDVFRRAMEGIATQVISRIDEKGREIGRTFIKLNRSFFETGATKAHGDWLKKYKAARKEKRLELLRELKSLGVSVRFVPMPGYRFNEKIADFEHFKRHKPRARRNLKDKK